MHAARGGHYPLVKMLIAERAQVNFQDTNGWTALMNHLHVGGYNPQILSTEIVEALLKAGADPNLSNGSRLNSLHYAVYHDIQSANHPTVVARLINAGARIDQQDQAGKTALFYTAAFADNGVSLESLRILLAAKPNLNIQDEDGCSPLMIAVCNGNEQAAKMLLDAGADINLKNKRGKTAYDNANLWSPKVSKGLRVRLNPGFFRRVFG
jgi:ankyrin repeat protein